MGEKIIRQENFDDILDEKENKKETGVEKHDKCQYCEDVGVCSFCERGKEYASKQPKSNLFEKMRESRKEH